MDLNSIMSSCDRMEHICVVAHQGSHSLLC